MERITDLIYVVNKFVDKHDCQQIYEFLNKNVINSITKENYMPWEVGNNIFYNNIEDISIKEKIYSIKFAVANMLSYLHNTKVYPHLTDIVLWKENQFMNRHVDNGLQNLIMRKFSAIIYLNDNYKGGKTFVKMNENEDYVSKPKTGRLLMFTSDERTSHGVTKIKSGTRGTIAMWFATEKKYIEKE